MQAIVMRLHQCVYLPSCRPLAGGYELNNQIGGRMDMVVTFPYVAPCLNREQIVIPHIGALLCLGRVHTWGVGYGD